jgi:hypothetical protein
MSELGEIYCRSLSSLLPSSLIIGSDSFNLISFRFSVESSLVYFSIAYNFCISNKTYSARFLSFKKSSSNLRLACTQQARCVISSLA